MAYQVLARKWRPQTFEEMVGQEHVLKALMNALDKQRLHHAYLFTGTRGVGKTTLARILARSLNCETGVSAHPCGECSACRQINEGRFVDLIEVDAASRTKVDDTRELLDNVQYKPTVGRYKVYLIDEVHMLSNHSFNALLKTLEEPPEHVKFLLATTDPQKLPVTVLSRCLQFNLKRVPEELIVAHMADILGREHVSFEEAALRALAQGADGSIRDGLSLLDQAIAFGDGQVNEAETVAMLGSISREYMLGLVEALATGDAETVMQVVERLAEFSPDFRAILDALITFFHDIALAQMAPSVLQSRLADSTGVMALAQNVLPEDVQLWYEIAVHGMSTIGLSSNPRVGFEMVLLRMLAFRPLPVGRDAAPIPDAAAKKKLLSSPEPVARPAAAAVPQPAASSRPGASPSIIAQRMADVQAAIKGTALKTTVVAPTKNTQPALSPVEEVTTPVPVSQVVPAAPVPLQPGPGVESLNGEDSAPPWGDEEPPPWVDESGDSWPMGGASAPAADTLAPDVLPPVDFEPQVLDGAEPSADSSRRVSILAEVIEDDEWGRLTASLDLPPMARELANNCHLEQHEGRVMVLRLSARHETLRSETNVKRLQQALSDYHGEQQVLEFRVESEVVDTPAHKHLRRTEQSQLLAEAAIENDRVVQRLRELFGASVVPGSVRPL